jgi:hypothetical protein
MAAPPSARQTILAGRAAQDW